MDDKLIATAFQKRAVLAALFHKDGIQDESSLEELKLLTKTAGAKIISHIIQRKDKPSATFLFGKGKIEEIRAEILTNKANLLITDNDLTPAQLRNIEQELKVQVMDRTELILDIFATHVRSNEAKLQVELAKMKYLMPRIVGRRTFLDQIRMGGASGAVAGHGPGEKQIEYDRRLVRRKTFELQNKIEEIQNRRKRLVEERASKNYTICLVGYTNAGKSTLLNCLTKANTYVDDKLFATLDTKTSTWKLSNGLKLLLSDTVGFIKNLPHNLVSSFYATLEEVRQANLLIHVADSSDPFCDNQIKTVNDVLAEIGCTDIETILVLNKIDKLKDEMKLNSLKLKYPTAQFISCLTSDGIENMENAVLGIVKKRMSEMKLCIPAGEGKLIADISEYGIILDQKVQQDNLIINALIPVRLTYKYKIFQISDT